METQNMSVVCYLITIVGDVVYIRQGGNVTLKCVQLSNITTWYGPPNFKKYTSGAKTNPALPDRISVSSDNNLQQFNLNIDHIKEEDEGNYKCSRVFSNNTIDCQTYKLELVTDPTNMKIIGQNSRKLVNGIEGQKLNLGCKVKSGHPPEILYFTSGNNTLVQGGPGSLQFSFVPKRDDNKREITCHAVVNDTMYTLEKMFALYVQIRPVVMISPGPVIKVVEKNDVFLKCNFFSNNPIDLVIWIYFDGKMNKTLLKGSKNDLELHLKVINRKEAGHYQCIVINAAGRGSESVSVIVQYAPTLTVVLQSIRSVRTLLCNAEGNPDKYIFYDWEHKSELGDHIRYLPSSRNGTLVINKVEGETDRHHDNGIYICHVSNGILIDGKTNVSKKYHLKDQGTPFFVSSNKAIQYGLFRRKTEIIVYVVSIPPPLNYTVSNSQLQSNGTLNIVSDIPALDIVYDVNVTVKTVRLSYSLQIESVHDFKPYHFRVKNVLGTTFFTVTLTPETQIKALIKALPSAVVSVGDSLTLSCKNADIQIPVQILWGYNNNILSGNEYKIDHKTVFIHFVNRHHAGNYSCELNSVFGNDTASIFVTVQEKNKTPPIVSVLITVTILTLIVNSVGICCKQASKHKYFVRRHAETRRNPSYEMEDRRESVYHPYDDISRASSGSTEEQHQEPEHM